MGSGLMDAADRARLGALSPAVAKTGGIVSPARALLIARWVRATVTRRCRGGEGESSTLIHSHPQGCRSTQGIGGRA